MLYLNFMIQLLGNMTMKDLTLTNVVFELHMMKIYKLWLYLTLTNVVFE